MANDNTTFNFQLSNLVLMVGGQIFFLALVIMIVLFGPPTLAFPASNVRNMLKSGIVNGRK